MSKERPILFNGSMVRAILEGRKTQTRRIISPRPDEDGLLKPIGADYWNDTSEREYRCPYGQPGDRLWVRETWRVACACLYRADERERVSAWKWKPSIHMPRWASRITLEIVNVRAERLYNMRSGDTIAEGMDRGSPMTQFAMYWESIHGVGSWAENPWVWIIEFKRA